MRGNTPLTPVIFAKIGKSQPLSPQKVVDATAAMTPAQAAQTRQNIGAGEPLTPEQIAEGAGAWLDEHVDPETGYVLDNSLTIQGAAADAKAAGDKIGEVKSAISGFEGGVHITSALLRQGVYSADGNTFYTSEKRRISYRFPVKKGGAFLCTAANQWLFVRLYVGSTIMQQISETKAPVSLTCEYDGEIAVSFCTARTYNNCANILPTDYIGDTWYFPPEVANTIKKFDYIKTISKPIMIDVDHRGYTTDAPENTIPAFALSKAYGFEWVEADVQLTADEIPVLLHDATIDRTSNGTGNIANLTLAEAREYNFSKGYPLYPTAQIPTLEEFLIFCKTAGIKAVIELKAEVSWTQARINNIISLTNTYMHHEDVIFASFSLEALQFCLTADDATNVSYIRNTATEEGVRYATSLLTGKNKAYFSCDYHSIRNNQHLFANKRIGVNGWTVGKTDILEYGMISPVIDIITTDDVKVSEKVTNFSTQPYTYQIYTT